MDKIFNPEISKIERKLLVKSQLKIDSEQQFVFDLIGIINLNPISFFKKIVNEIIGFSFFKENYLYLMIKTLVYHDKSMGLKAIEDFLLTIYLKNSYKNVEYLYLFEIIEFLYKNSDKTNRNYSFLKKIFQLEYICPRQKFNFINSCTEISLCKNSIEFFEFAFDVNYQIYILQNFLTRKILIGESLLKLKNILISNPEKNSEIADIIINSSASTKIPSEYIDMANNILFTQQYNYNENFKQRNQSFFNNKENVHNKNISKCSFVILEQIYNKLNGRKINLITSEFLETELLLNNFEEKSFEILRVFDRIENFDQGKYKIGNNMFSLKYIFCYIVSYIETVHNLRSTLIKRLFEEMIDMYDTCATGYLVRLANIFVGIILDFEIKIDETEYIESLIFEKINKLINNDVCLIESTNLISEPKYLELKIKHFPKIVSDLTLDYPDLEISEIFYNTICKYEK